MAQRFVQLLDKIKTPKNLPSLPQILLKVTEICNSEARKIEDISQIIHKDAALCAKVMEMVGSTGYGRSKRVTHIDQALMILGPNAIKNIADSASAIQAFSKAKDISVFELKVFWKHALMCAVLSELIAKKTSYAAPDEAFLTGLLHDIGRLILRVNFPSQYADILNPLNDQGDLISAKDTHPGGAHCEVGAWLIKRWNFQSFMADAVLYHHEPENRIQDALPLVKIIYVANVLCPETNKAKAVKFGIANNIFGFEKAEIKKIIIQAEKVVSDAAKYLDIDIELLDISEETVSAKDHEKQEDLILKVKDAALLQGTLQNLLEAFDEDSILEVMQQGLNILFDVKDALFFLYETKRNLLLCKSAGPNKQHDLIHDVTIPFQEKKSLLVKSLLQGNFLDSFSDSTKDNPTIIDEQIIRFAQKDGILCLPMVAHEQYIGVIVLGIEAARVFHLYEKKKLLIMFAKQAALAMHANGLRQKQTTAIPPEHPEDTSPIVRKVVHEVNTPLSIIKSYLAILMRKLPEDGSVYDEIKIINEEVDRVSQIIRELSEGSKRAIQAGDALDLNVFLSDLISVYQDSLLMEPGIKAHLKLDPLLPSIMTDKNRMNQIFSNLIKNAAEAMPGGGNLYISTRFVSDDTDTAMNRPADSIPGHAEITVADDGPGIDDIVKSRLFEPYVTSKGAGHTGLGLSIVYQTVNELKGTLTCERCDKKGTSFKIVFPITHNQP